MEIDEHRQEPDSVPQFCPGLLHYTSRGYENYKTETVRSIVHWPSLHGSPSFPSLLSSPWLSWGGGLGLLGGPRRKYRPPPGRRSAVCACVHVYVLLASLQEFIMHTNNSRAVSVEIDHHIIIKNN